MAVNVRIPTTMRPIAGGASSVQVDGVTLADVLANLDSAHPGFHERLFDDAGAVHFSINGRAGLALGDSGTPLTARISRDDYQDWLIKP